MPSSQIHTRILAQKEDTRLRHADHKLFSWIPSSSHFLFITGQPWSKHTRLTNSGRHLRGRHQAALFAPSRSARRNRRQRRTRKERHLRPGRHAIVEETHAAHCIVPVRRPVEHVLPCADASCVQIVGRARVFLLQRSLGIYAYIQERVGAENQGV